jgi:hypothetical protein
MLVNLQLLIQAWSNVGCSKTWFNNIYMSTATQRS